MNALRDWAEDPIAWRWELAGRFSTSARLPPECLGDDLLVRAWRYHRRHGKPITTRAKPGEPDADLDAACRLHEGTSEARWLLEAMYVGGAAIERMAKQVGLPAIVISVYLGVFFDVDELRDSLMFPLEVVRTHGRPMTAAELPDRLWKLIALQHGVDTLLDVIDPGVTLTPVHQAAVRDLFAVRVRFSAFQSSMTARPNDDRPGNLMQWSNQLDRALTRQRTQQPVLQG